MLNFCAFMGRLTKDPEMRRTQGGTAVATCFIAVERDYQGKDNDRAVDFIPIVAWKEKAEFLSKYFSKGKMIIVRGALQSRSYTDKDGNKRSQYEVVADKLDFGEAKKSDTSPYQEPVTNVYQGALEGDDTDLPY